MGLFKDAPSKGGPFLPRGLRDHYMLARISVHRATFYVKFQTRDEYRGFKSMVQRQSPDLRLLATQDGRKILVRPRSVDAIEENCW